MSILRNTTLTLLALCAFIILPAQKRSLEERLPDLKYKGRMMLYWGYNRAIYTKSDVHFHGPEYDITFYDLVAHDRQTPFNFNDYLNPARFTIPQFNVRAAYQFSERFGISAGYDHMKYVMDGNQKTTWSGVVEQSASPKYQGTYLNDSVTVTKDLLWFEHTDGLNNVSIELEYSELLFRAWKDRIRLRSVLGIGWGMVVPRSDVHVFEEGLNNHWNIAGYSMGAQASLRVEFMERWFCQFSSRAGFINLPNVLVANDAPERGDHGFSFLEGYWCVGAYIRLRNMEKSGL